jgi:hypothetical protein
MRVIDVNYFKNISLSSILTIANQFGDFFCLCAENTDSQWLTYDSNIALGIETFSVNDDCDTMIPNNTYFDYENKLFGLTILSFSFTYQMVRTKKRLISFSFYVEFDEYEVESDSEIEILKNDGEISINEKTSITIDVKEYTNKAIYFSDFDCMNTVIMIAGLLKMFEKNEKLITCALESLSKKFEFGDFQETILGLRKIDSNKQVKKESFAIEKVNL